MSTENQLPPPPVKWAQSRSIVFITFCLDECKKPTVTVDSDKIYFKGFNETEKKDYEVTINLYGEIDPEKTMKNDKGRHYELSLTKKKTDGPFWPTLTKENKKYHWLKCDFNKWNDEEDTDSDNEYNDFSKALQGMDSFSGAGANFDSKPDLSDLGDMDSDDDSDNENMPDLHESPDSK